jgi:flagellar hook-length control protein FliK
VSQSALLSNLKTADPLLQKNLEESVMTQVTEKLNAAVKNGITEMRIMLRPESLGEMHLKIRLEGDVVMAKIYVENQQVKHIVESNLVMLKDALAQHNLQAGTFSVDVNSGNNGMRDHMGSAQDLAAQQGQDGDGKQAGSDNGAAREESSETDMANGIETGRRFGNNTIEFFA